jgi:uncharacterized membrane protein
MELLLIIVGITGLAIAPIFRRLYIWRAPVRKFAVFWAGVLIWIAGVTLLIVYGFGYAFGPGLMIMLLMVPLGVVAFITLYFPLPAGDGRRGRVPLWVGLGLALLVVSPILWANLTGSACNRLNRETGDQIAAALTAYHADFSMYPDDLAALVPDYLPELPAASCLTPFEWLGSPVETPYWLSRCPQPTGDPVTVLSTVQIMGIGDARYDFATGEWASRSFLDDTCYP